MPPPKSPLDKPSPAHPRRPGAHRRSSSEKVTTNKASKHERKQAEPLQASIQGVMTEPSEVGSPTQTDLEGGTKRTDDLGSAGNIALQSTAPLSKTEVRQTVSQQRGALQLEDRSGDRIGLPKDTSPAELERLRAAMNAQIRLNQHREALARQLETREERGSALGSPSTAGAKTRVSPINEETSWSSMEESFGSPLASGLETTSTESARTIRGGFTPGPTAVRTPSYPFPSMRGPAMSQYGSHRPFTALSPTVNPSNYAGGSFSTGPQDQVMSGSVTPSSTVMFQPQPTSDIPDDPNFETPNLYDLSLMMSAEPGLDAWWTTVVQIMRNLYKADRVTLSVPADPTDVENVPWGQKATFNALEEDEMSLAYLPRGSSFVPSTVDTNETSASEGTNVADDFTSIPPQFPTPHRPGLSSRHSFTAYENTKREPPFVPEASRAAAAARPGNLARAKSYLAAPRTDSAPRSASLQNANLNLQYFEDHVAIEQAAASEMWENPESSSREAKGHVFDVLQALDFEAEPLIDNEGVLRALKRGKVIALTRDYPYVENPSDEQSGGSKSSQRSTRSKDSQGEAARSRPADVSSRISSFLGGRSRKSSRGNRSQGGEKSRGAASSTRGLDDDEMSASQRYEEYEQAPPSPWSQSPAPSPAVRAETSENPFFVNAPVDEETFNPQNATPQDYSDIPQPEAIGVDRSWTVLHIPLIHPLLSKPVHAFRLDTAGIEMRSMGRGKGVESQPKDSTETRSKVTDEKVAHTPIAILSILSPVIPYPSSLRNSLSHLSPHLATSFSLCRHFTNLQTEVNGLSRKRPAITGFGGVVPGAATHPRHDDIELSNVSYSPVYEGGPQRSTGGSITSPSDYSGLSRSNAGSPGGTPGWDPATVGLSLDRKSSSGSPSNIAAESYFSSRTRPGLGRVDTGSATSFVGVRRTSKESSPAESRAQKVRLIADETILEPATPVRDYAIEPTRQKALAETHTGNTTPKQESRHSRTSTDTMEGVSDNRELSPSRPYLDDTKTPKKSKMRTATIQGTSRVERQHTQLHSYGADFSATFQSLPNPSAGMTKSAPLLKAPARAGSLTQGPDPIMPPPSDKVKSIMLDALPLHVFIALPPTGEVVWVNSRYLTYRGQSVRELHEDPWASIHPDEREEYLKAWKHSLRTGEQLSMQIRLRRFDGSYRWFYTRAVGLKDNRGVIVQWYGTYMDIHDQHVAEVKAARQEEIEASEAKHRQLANLIPQIIFSATEEDGVTFANQQWLSYTGQDFEDALGLGFMDYVHPEDLAKCHIPFGSPPTPARSGKKLTEPMRMSSHTSSGGKSSNKSGASEAPTETTIKGKYQSLSRSNSSSSTSVYEYSSADLAELTRTGVIKVDTDSEGRVSYSTEVRLRSKTGEYRWHLVRCVEVDNINLGTGDGSWFGACADINDHKLLEKKLKDAMDSKSKFLSNMSHEIRTPLIGISGMISFLQDTPLNDEQIDYCNTIASSAEGLLNIINDILDLAKADAGMMKLTYDWFHSRSLVEEVNDMVSTIAITKHLEVNYVVDAEVPEMIKGDRFRIRQVLLNVIGNAIKFTTEGEVFSRCKVLTEETSKCGDNEVVLEFSIIDTGRGFTQEEAEVIFKPFSQIDASSTRTHGGTGLGLVISRQLVELHGGKMEGTAVPGKGSTFTFSARFGLPTTDDYPEPPSTPAAIAPPLTKSSLRSSISSASNEAVTRAIKQAGGNPVVAKKLLQSPAEYSPRTESSVDSPTVMSSGSSAPSLHSVRTYDTHRSSASSMTHNLAHFGEAARSISGDASAMKLALPERPSPSITPSITSPSGTTPTPTNLREATGTTISRPSISSTSSSELKHFRPPMYSILIICPQTHSREATTQHIEMTLPKDVPHQITALASVPEARSMIGGDDPILFTHIVINLGSAEEIVSLIDQILPSTTLAQTSIVVLSDPVQRQEVKHISASYDYDKLAKENRVTFIYKPVKPSRFAVIFDPDKERDLSTDRNRFTAQQQVETQRQSYLDIGKRLGNKGLRVLLVEDNVTNQKVLLKFLSKVGVEVELALDGVECTQKVFGSDHGYYSLILCDLHMPNKDGYQACREIREWEQTEKHPPLPIIALSANVMADVLEKCREAGFSNYITKPVDFKALSLVMGDLLDPASTEKEPLRKK